MCTSSQARIDADKERTWPWDGMGDVSVKDGVAVAWHAAA